MRRDRQQAEGSKPKAESRKPYTAFCLRPPAYRNRGFTLAELTITVVILGILAAIAVPTFQRTIERSFWREAQDLLLTIYTGERAYFLANNAYFQPGDWNTIFMDNPNIASIPVAFSVPTASRTSFTARATRTTGPCSSSTLQIDETRTFAPLTPPARCWCGAC